MGFGRDLRTRRTTKNSVQTIETVSFVNLQLLYLSSNLQLLYLSSKCGVSAIQVKAACNKPGLVPKLEIIVVELEKCKKSLSEYLRWVVIAVEVFTLVGVHRT